MAPASKIRTIAFDNADEIVAAIRSRENFEVGGCQGKMSNAILFVKNIIQIEGLTFKVYTKGRMLLLIPSFILLLGGGGLVSFVSLIESFSIRNVDCKIMKRPVAKALRISFKKNAL